MDEQLASAPGASIFDSAPAPEDSNADGALSPNLPRTRRVGQGRRLLVALGQEGAAVSTAELGFAVSQRSMLAAAYAVPVERVASFRVEARLTSAQACASAADLAVSLRETFQQHLQRTAPGSVHAIEILAAEVDRRGVECGRRAAGAGLTAARAVMDMLVVFPLSSPRPTLDLLALARLPNVVSATPLSVSDGISLSPATPTHFSVPDQTPAEAQKSMDAGLLAGACAGGAAALLALVCAVRWMVLRRQVAGREVEVVAVSLPKQQARALLVQDSGSFGLGSHTSDVMMVELNSRAAHDVLQGEQRVSAAIF